MAKKVLATGGTGFIGSHLIDKLIDQKEYEVSILNILEEQVHGNVNHLPDYLNKNTEFFQGSVTDFHKELNKN